MWYTGNGKKRAAAFVLQHGSKPENKSVVRSKKISVFVPIFLLGAMLQNVFSIKINR